jgi:hypothetical protein
MRRRLFERLEQRIEAVAREHVHLVDEVHLEARPRRSIGDVFEQLAGLVDLGARGGVDFEQIDEATAIDLATGRADAAGMGADALLAVECLGQDAGECGLADAAGAGEQIGVVELIAVERIGERAHDMLLPDHIVERPGTPFAGKHLIGHHAIISVRAWAGWRNRGQGRRTAYGGGDPRQPHPGTRFHRCGCSLPGLTGFTVSRCEGTGTGHHNARSTAGAAGASAEISRDIPGTQTIQVARRPAPGRRRGVRRVREHRCSMRR